MLVILEKNWGWGVGGGWGGARGGKGGENTKQAVSENHFLCFDEISFFFNKFFLLKYIFQKVGTTVRQTSNILLLVKRGRP